MDFPVKVASWIAKMLSEADGKPSVKRICLLLAVSNCIGIGIALLARPELSLDLAKTLLITTAGAYGVTRFAEKP
jgi:hypothetical protein